MLTLTEEPRTLWIVFTLVGVAYKEEVNEVAEEVAEDNVSVDCWMFSLFDATDERALLTLPESLDLEILLLIELGLDEEEGEVVTVVYCVDELFTVPPNSSREDFLTGGGKGALLLGAGGGSPSVVFWVLLEHGLILSVPRFESVEPLRFSGSGAVAAVIDSLSFLTNVVGNEG